MTHWYPHFFDYLDMLRPKLCHEYYDLPIIEDEVTNRFFDPVMGSPMDAIPELKEAYNNLYNYVDPDDEATWENHGMPDYTVVFRKFRLFGAKIDFWRSF